VAGGAAGCLRRWGAAQQPSDVGIDAVESCGEGIELVVPEAVERELAFGDGVVRQFCGNLTAFGGE
jgi:hypothetical protein